MQNVAVLGAGAIGCWTGLSIALGNAQAGLTPEQSRVLLVGQSSKPWFSQGRTELASEVRSEFPSVNLESGQGLWVRRVPADLVQYLPLAAPPSDSPPEQPRASAAEEDGPTVNPVERARLALSSCRAVLVAVKAQHTPAAAQLLTNAFPEHLLSTEERQAIREAARQASQGDVAAAERKQVPSLRAIEEGDDPYGPLAISLQNGLQGARDLKTHLPNLAVLSAVVDFNVVDDGSGRYLKTVGRGFTIESPPPDSPWMPRFRQLIQAMQRSGLWVRVVPREEILRHQYAKLLINLHNGINALAGHSLAQTYADRRLRTVLAACHSEALALLRAAGIKPLSNRLPPQWLPCLLRLPDWLFRPLWSWAVRMSPHAKSSTLQDLEAGRRSTEIALLNGEWVRLARQLQPARDPQLPAVAMPPLLPLTIMAVQTLVERAAFDCRGSPCLSPDQLLAAVSAQSVGGAPLGFGCVAGPRLACLFALISLVAAAVWRLRRRR